MIFLRWLKRKSLQFVVIFCISLFSVSCNRKQSNLSDSLSAKEKQDLDYFFRMILFDSPGGAFVLFGSKPLSEISHFDTTGQEDPPFQRNPALGWKAFENLRNKYQLKKYIFVRRDDEIILADIQKTALTLAEHYNVFKECIGVDFHPMEIVFELENPESEFWNRVFSLPHHLEKGLLFGFGMQNSLLWEWQSQYVDKSGKIADYFLIHPLATSTPRPVMDPNILARYQIKIASRPEELEIPFFGVADWDEQAEKYRKEAEKIKQIYRGKDLVEVTLRQLFSE